MLSYCDFCERAFHGEGVECEVPGLMDALMCPTCSEDEESQMTLGFSVEVAEGPEIPAWFSRMMSLNAPLVESVDCSCRVRWCEDRHRMALALWEEESCRRGEQMMRAAIFCSCSYYTRLPCPHRAQLELFDTRGPECRDERGLPSGTLSHVTHDFPVSPSWGARTCRGLQRYARPSWVADLIPPPYVSFPVTPCTFAQRQRY
jgi:hypothetical protein